MKKLIITFIITCSITNAYSQPVLNADMANQLSQLPLHCITTEFPNKTSHLSDAPTDHQLLPHELHPVFYGCLDWHSSVHGHWMLVKLLKKFPEIVNREKIIQSLENSFQLEKMKQEAEYFGKYTASNIYERTYGWAWLLKLDEELYTWDSPLAKRWHQSLQPLTQKIVSLWKAYLPKQTYPNRSGMHGNSAFALCFAYDWATRVKDHAFKQEIEQKATYFYLNNKNTPAYLEPDGADFFSPSLQIADLMTRILKPKKYQKWLQKFYSPRSINRLCQSVTVSDRNDYQTVHLDGLAFSRAWCMKDIANVLPPQNKLKLKLKKTAEMYLNETLPQLFNGGYGGEHWLASFAVYALDR